MHAAPALMLASASRRFSQGHENDLYDHMSGFSEVLQSPCRRCWAGSFGPTGRRWARAPLAVLNYCRKQQHPVISLAQLRQGCPCERACSVI